ncbi:MAG: sensor domain-containing diguanylate cyclase [Gammaproteobacteria bacterium]|nr:sensor domain-containing diguanylate cyclase [Gammaproteobacteria bacterium]MBU0770711.1 sensor domain-containing diguanylate cyclase [Gammaproteobacteria bacterium]MBU0857585.1 sensor domain-containing diguanylate cyclase [Gammaproteobacteria bacterium]MBU1848671.1 sensor domain-containing diguanylate cyclase [Gammaproteobacteria bacterium]
MPAAGSADMRAGKAVGAWRITATVTGKHRLLLLLGALLLLGFLATTLVSYFVSKNQIHRSIVENELPLTSDNIYSEIQKDLIRPVFIASMMAGDTFLRDWVLQGEADVPAMTKYLGEVRTRYGTFTSFFVSERTRRYYHPEGMLRKVSENEPQDRWFFRVRGLNEPYEINVDTDTRSRETLAVFINYRVYDYAGGLMGVTGVGLTVDMVRNLLSGYQKRYHRSVYFVDKTGQIVLFGDRPSHGAANLNDVPGMRNIVPRMLATEGGDGSYAYSNGGHDYLLNVRYVPEMKWFLVVEKVEDEALADIRRTLYINLVVCLTVTLAVLYLSHLTLGRYQRRLEAMATTDRLTGLLNRHAFEILMVQALADARRSRQPMCALLIDIDHFKALNDRYGHLAGDRMIEHVGALIRSSLRASDVACRWGGEEFLLLLKNCADADALVLADALRVRISESALPLAERPVARTVSIGVAAWRAGDTPETLMDRADGALYAAKREGRDRVVLA